MPILCVMGNPYPDPFSSPSHPLPLQTSVMTPLQMFRSALHALSDPGGGLLKGLAMTREQPPPTSTSSSVHPPSVSGFKRHHEVVFLDPSGWLNLTVGMTKSAMDEVSGKKEEAGTAGGTSERFLESAPH